MADTKWIPGLDARMPVTEAAQRVLSVRIGHVLQRLPPAVEHPDEDIEHVHQLRVGTRRAGAAVRIFVEFITPSRHRRMKRTLRRIRRAAGDARDWDVFLEAMNTRWRRRTASQAAGLDFLLGLGHGHRVAAQDELREATDGQCERLRQIIDELGDSINGAGKSMTLRELAVSMLTTLQHEFEQGARGDLHAYEALHQVRIKGKHLRYAMEIFESCFDAGLRLRVYPSIADMQEILGTANDSHVAGVMLDQLRQRMERIQPAAWKRYRTAIEQLQAYHRRRMPQQRQLFEEWWEKWQSSGLSAALSKWLRA